MNNKKWNGIKPIFPAVKPSKAAYPVFDLRRGNSAGRNKQVRDEAPSFQYEEKTAVCTAMAGLNSLKISQLREKTPPKLGTPHSWQTVYSREAIALMLREIEENEKRRERGKK